MQTKKTLERKITPEEFYSELTNPNQHHPDNFCYIIHALNPVAKNELLLATLKHRGYDFSQEIDLLSEPERISEKIIISSSIISQDLTASWGNAFFILDVPWNNFVSMSERDCGTNVTHTM